MMKKLKFFTVGILGAWFIKLLASTIRIYDDPKGFTEKTQTTHAIYTFWHCLMLVPAYVGRHKNIQVLISQHSDGEYIAQVIKRFGIIVLAPSSSVLPIADLAFEHRMYLPLAAVIAVVVVSGHALLSHAAQRRGWTVAMRHRMAVGLLLACAGALMAFTIRRNRDYASELVLWQDVLAQNKDHYRAHHALGSLLAEAGKLDESVAHFKEVLRLKPRFADAHTNFANVLMDRGDVAGAIEHYRQAVTLKPRYVSAHYNLGRALAKGRETGMSAPAPVA